MAARAGSPVYCAGPMFSHAEKRQQHSIAEALEQAGHEAYLPQRDGIEVARVMAMARDSGYVPRPDDPLADLLPKMVFALDIYQLLSRCRSVVFTMDGRVPDEGAVAETAVAFVVGRPIVVYKSTPLTLIESTDNPLVKGLSTTWSYVHEVRDIVPALDRAAAAPPGAYEPPVHLAGVLRLGELVWEHLVRAREERHPVKGLMELVTELIGHVSASGEIDKAFPQPAML